jgi:hypothetical protein
MTDEELVKRLRKGDTPMANHYMDEAADRIEALTAELATCEKYRDAYAECDRIGTQTVRDLEAMNKNQEAMIRQADRRGDALEAKLAKAVEALRDMCAEFRGYDLPYGSKAYVKATTTLAKIENSEAVTLGEKI